jgi:hypothetical protein
VAAAAAEAVAAAAIECGIESEEVDLIGQQPRREDCMKIGKEGGIG